MPSYSPIFGAKKCQRTVGLFNAVDRMVEAPDAYLGQSRRQLSTRVSILANEENL